MQISNFSSTSSKFPDGLREVDPAVKAINVLGTLPGDAMIAVVGSRRPTPYGEHITYQITSELAKAGAVIVSGLAIGVDTIAHRAALDAGGKTIAVLAGGLDSIYPARNRNLAKEILASGGALISEYDLGTQAYPSNFVERNRIIAGLCAATIVTEAAAKSGALITAHRALKYNRVVMAVPGNITSALSAGPNNLIRTGATPVTSAADAIVELGFHAREAVYGQGCELLAKQECGPGFGDDFADAESGFDAEWQVRCPGPHGGNYFGNFIVMPNQPAAAAPGHYPLLRAAEVNIDASKAHIGNVLSSFAVELRIVSPDLHYEIVGLAGRNAQALHGGFPPRRLEAVSRHKLGHIGIWRRDF